MTGEEGPASAPELLEEVNLEAIVAGRSDWIGPDLAAALARGPLACIDREFPHYQGSIDSPEGFERPRERHPAFYGCFDWHSAVHSHWSLVRQLRVFDDHPVESEIVEVLRDRLTASNVEAEVAYFEASETFERPYGWGWLLRLAAELRLWDDDRADDWRVALEPLEQCVVDLVERTFLSLERPWRTGTHGNSAFALSCVLDYARTTANESLESRAIETARRWFADDEKWPVAYEPFGRDFLSPALTEAALMRRVLDRDAFATWLDDFLPDAETVASDGVLEPVQVPADPDEGLAYHFVGLNLSRAWCLLGIAAALDDRRAAVAFERSAERHAEIGLRRAFESDYAGAHWLTSYAVYLLTSGDGGIGVT